MIILTKIERMHCSDRKMAQDRKRPINTMLLNYCIQEKEESVERSSFWRGLRSRLCLFLLCMISPLGALGCGGLGLWDMKVAGTAGGSRFEWMAGGENARIRVWEKKGEHERKVMELQYELKENHKRKVLLILKSEEFGLLAKSYKNRCVENPETIELFAEIPKGDYRTKMVGYIPPVVTRLFDAIAETFPLARKSALGKNCPPACGSVASPESKTDKVQSPGDQNRKEKSAKQPGTGASEDDLEGKDKVNGPNSTEANDKKIEESDNVDVQEGEENEEEELCMDSAVGIFHEPVEEFWHGKPAEITAIIPKNWSLVLHYKPGMVEHYKAVEMEPVSASEVCRLRFLLPQSALTYDTLYYYIEAKDESGEVANGFSSKNSPHIVTVKKCLLVSH